MMDLKDLAAGSYRWPEALRIFGSLQNQASSYCFVLCLLTDINKQIATGVTGATFFVCFCFFTQALRSTVVTYGAVMTFLPRSGWFKALALFQQLSEYEIRRSVIAFNTMMSAMRSKQWQGACYLLGAEKK